MSFARSDSVRVAVSNLFCVSVFVVDIILSSPLAKDLTIRLDLITLQLAAHRANGVARDQQFFVGRDRCRRRAARRLR